MSTPFTTYRISVFIFCVSTLYGLTISFSPVDNYLINCGSTVDSTMDNRRFTAESSSFDREIFSSARAVRLRAETPTPGLPEIYDTASIFERPATYKFNVRKQGFHMVRLHFHRFHFSKINFDSAQFHVLVNGYVVLRNFTGVDMAPEPRIKDFLIPVDGKKLVVRFVPRERSKFAFVNAIEVVSAAADLIADTAKLIKGDVIEDCSGLTKQALEVMYRINVGGPKVTPFNDSMWRTWIPDDEFLRSRDGAAKKVHFSGRINYQIGGASRGVCPDNVYNAARVVVSENASIPDLKLLWEFPVVEGYKYLVRLHFCDIASISTGLLFFNVYVNGRLAYENLDLSFFTNYALASPLYMDFVVDGGGDGSGSVLSVSVGPSSRSLDHAVDAILNGIEILKMSNSMGSLDGEMSAEMIRKGCPGIATGEWLPVLAFACLLLGVSVEIYKRRIAVANPSAVAWSRLPTDPKGASQGV